MRKNLKLCLANTIILSLNAIPIHNFSLPMVRLDFQAAAEWIQDRRATHVGLLVLPESRKIEKRYRYKIQKAKCCSAKTLIVNFAQKNGKLSYS